MNNGPFKNIVDAVRDWTKEKLQPLQPGEVYDTVPNDIIKMLWDGDIEFEDLAPVSGSEDLDPVDTQTNYEHFMQIFYPDNN